MDLKLEPKIFYNHSLCSIKALQQQLKFEYLSTLIFDDDSDLNTSMEKDIEQGKTKGRIELEGHRYLKFFLPSPSFSISIKYVSEAVGYGAFAQDHLKKGDYVGEYTGVVRKNNRLYVDPFNPYCYQYPIVDEIGRHYVIDATKGNWTRFINHSSCPNLKPVYVLYEGKYHVVFKVIKTILPQDPFSYDYGPYYWYLRGAPVD